MSLQKKISSFFTTASVPVSAGKRHNSNKNNEDEPNSKCIKDSSDCTQNFKLSSNGNSGALCDLTSAQNSNLTMDNSWRRALQPEFEKPYYKRLMAFVTEERSKFTIYPPKSQVFSWMQHRRIRDVKVVILGQDPYHGPGQAHGLCFSVRKGVPPPPSLENIFKELTNDVPSFSPPGHGDLTGWARQGVLLLNAVLTVRSSQANSHKDKGWETFTDAVISWLNNNLSGVVFMLWGSYAQKKGARINAKRHHVLKAVHPSPLSAYRGFFGCKHFSKANEILTKQGEKPIDWKDL